MRGPIPHFFQMIWVKHLNLSPRTANIAVMTERFL